jgi:hypothetical protein
MKITQIAINSFIGFLGHSKAFNRVRGLVEQVENQNISGPEKKAAVLDAAKSIGLELSTWLFNLLIEIAVLWVKSKQGKV